MSKREPGPSPKLGDESKQRQPPKDSLDFKLSTIYNHHTALFWSKNQMLCQRETHALSKRKREKLEKQLKLKQEQETSIRVWVDPRRNTYHYLT
ncbi:cilia- and flagella-associated protein 276 [Poecilia reticulata]|uniref:cilia- and flagella-associated protein 276 n=1 Tax=Poecilia reticulata TaxID=8081 RepID=UPI0004A3DD79|nr:PREDICTED: uncharacterized protein C1orf194 homolog [Poecilia reticulata]